MQLRPNPKDQENATDVVYDEFIDLIARGGGAQSVLTFHPSERVQEYAYDLLTRKKNGTLNEREAYELEQFVQLEHLVRMAKIRARTLLAA
jgi:hypothetical protein